MSMLVLKCVDKSMRCMCHFTWHMALKPTSVLFIHVDRSADLREGSIRFV